jgi:VWFA-related protein
MWHATRKPLLRRRGFKPLLWRRGFRLRIKLRRTAVALAEAVSPAVVALGLSVLTIRSSTLFAQTSQSVQTPSSDLPVFRVGTHTVEADVIVRDQSGRFVSDLTRDDFELLDEGRPQRIEAVYLVTQSNAEGMSAVSATSTGSTAVRRLTAPRVLVLFFDDAHLSPGGFRHLQQAAEHLVQNVLRTGDVGGIVARGQMVGNRLTSDREELLAAVRGLKPSDETRSRRAEYQSWPRIASDIEAERIADGDAFALDVATRRACNDDPPACRAAPVNLEVQNKAKQIATELHASSQRTLATVRTLAAGLLRLDGRKTIILLSDGFTLGPFASQVQPIIGQAARSGVAFYGVDARGLARGNRGREFTDPTPADIQESSASASGYDSSEDALNALAVDTGGYVARNVNDFQKAFTDIADHGGTYYVLGYTPQDTTPDGKFHRLTVHVKREGVSITARKGYLAIEGPAARLHTPAPPESVSRDAPTEPTAGEAATHSAHAPSAVAGEPVADSALPNASSPEPTVVAGIPSVTQMPLTTALGTTGNNTGAIAHVQALAKRGEVARLDPTTVRDLAPALTKAHEGWEHYAAGDVEGAATLLRDAARAPDSPVWVNYALGQAEFARAQPARAISAWEDVRTREPEFAPVYFDLADAFLRTRNHDAAIRVLRQASDRWPRDPEIYNAIAVIQISRGTIDAGLDTLERALTVAPADALTHFNFAKACELKYVKSVRYIQPIRQYVRDESARKNAIAHYTRYLELDAAGAFANSAREGLQRLQWNP